MVRGAGEAQFDISFDVRITLSSVLFSNFFFFTDLLAVIGDQIVCWEDLYSMNR